MKKHFKTFSSILIINILIGCQDDTGKIILNQQKEIDSLKNVILTQNLLKEEDNNLLVEKLKNKAEKPGKKILSTSNVNEAISAVKDFMDNYHPKTKFLKESIHTVKQSNGTIDVRIEIIMDIIEKTKSNRYDFETFEYELDEKYNVEIGKQIITEFAFFNVSTFGKNNYKINQRWGIVF